MLMTRLAAMLFLLVLALAPVAAQDGAAFPASPDEVNPDGPGVGSLVDAWLAEKGLDPWGRASGAGIDLSSPPDAGSLSRCAWVWVHVEATTELHRYVWERLPRPEPDGEENAGSGPDAPVDGDGPAASAHDPTAPPDASLPRDGDPASEVRDDDGETQDLDVVLGGRSPAPPAEETIEPEAGPGAPTGSDDAAEESSWTGDGELRPGPPGGSLALAWALEKAEGTPNTQNERHPTADGLQWNDWCLLFVYTAWANSGKGVPGGISGADADEALGKFRSSGRLRPVDGAIPEGCPVFWAAKAERKWGHIALSTGRMAEDGSPLIVSSNSGSARPQVITRSLKWLNAWYGAEAAGWGWVPGTP